MLLPRFLTTVVGVPILLLSIWWGQLPFFILILGVAMLGLHEFYSLAEEASWPVSKKMGLATGFILILSIALFGTKMGWESPARSQVFFSPAVISFLLLLYMLQHLLSKDRQNAFINIAVTWLGLFYVVWTLSHLVLIRDLRPAGLEYTIFLFLVTWVLDIAAYLGGVRFGKHRLSHNISPKKTWEGALIGSAAALVTAFLCALIFLREVSFGQIFILGALVIVLSQVSDFSESLFKRNVQVKDSGTLLPGHGGILDRFDSFLLTAPLYYYTLVLLNK